MKFVGHVFQENGEMRGKISFLDDANTVPNAIYFKSFDELMKFLEEEYKKRNQ